ncbi:unnamed protein product [Orchesella dallaii]|uniref:Uncharacterized protein n=1 Tax=Orchesella dallaii TaxID=48710 RepID=A0ABP1SA80_9HEXA
MKIFSVTFLVGILLVAGFFIETDGLLSHFQPPWTRIRKRMARKRLLARHARSVARVIRDNAEYPMDHLPWKPVPFFDDTYSHGIPQYKVERLDKKSLNTALA